MNSRTKNRIYRILLTFMSVSIGIYILLNITSESISFFYSVSELPKNYQDKAFRVGGMIKKDSIRYKSTSEVEFVITDYTKDLRVIHKGIIPALFRDEQGIVAKGYLFDGNGYDDEMIFYSKELLAKHDENYMPDKLRTENK